MADSDRPPKTKGERALAVRRLNEAVTERRRLRDQQSMATDTSGEARAKASSVTDDGVTARERWLERVDGRGETR